MTIAVGILIGLWGLGAVVGLMFYGIRETIRDEKSTQPATAHTTAAHAGHRESAGRSGAQAYA